VGLAQLDNLVRIRQLKAEPPSQFELDGLIRSGGARLKDAALDNLSLDSRCDLAYNAAHSAAGVRAGLELGRRAARRCDSDDVGVFGKAAIWGFVPRPNDSCVVG
jgi:hypothetical protein